MIIDGNGIALGMEMESFLHKTSSNTATRKRPEEAPAVLVFLWFLCKNLKCTARKTPKQF